MVHRPGIYYHYKKLVSCKQKINGSGLGGVQSDVFSKYWPLGMSRIDGYSYTKRFVPCNESESDFRIFEKENVQLTLKQKNQMFHRAEIFR